MKTTGSKPIGPFRSRFYSDTYFIISLLDEHDRPMWAIVPNKRGVGFVFSSAHGLDQWLRVNGFLEPITQQVLEVGNE
jgi:hypothetical protein